MSDHKSSRKSKKSRHPNLTDAQIIAPKDIKLVRTKGTPGRGGDPDGESWKIEVAGQRAGVIFINFIDEPPIGPHASIQIFLNQRHRGRQVGRTAYRAACESSKHDIIYAHMRKSNTASRRAAEATGFKEATPPNHAQLIMRREKN